MNLSHSVSVDADFIHLLQSRKKIQNSESQLKLSTTNANPAGAAQTAKRFVTVKVEIPQKLRALRRSNDK